MEYCDKFRNQELLKTIKMSNQPNKIILTEKGLQKLGSMGQWGQSFDQSNKETVCSRFLKQRLQNSISFDRFTNNNTLTLNKKYSLTRTEQNLDKFSKKTIKKYELWENEQKQYTKILKRKLDKKINQKYRDYQWPEMTDSYKAGINEILNSWQSLNSAQNQRSKQRIMKIYHEKYLSSGSLKNQQNLRNYKQRSFLVPRSSKINYGQTKPKKKQNTQPKIYFKMIKTANEFHKK